MEPWEMKITINGEVVECVSNMTLAGVLACESYNLDRVAVEKNGVIIPRRDFDSDILFDGDKLEVVHFVGGG